MDAISRILSGGYGRVHGRRQRRHHERWYNNNNDALLSQTWVIATVAVLEVCTVPHVEPHNVQGELYPCYSYSCCGRARYDLGGELLPHVDVRQA